MGVSLDIAVYTLNETKCVANVVLNADLFGKSLHRESDANVLVPVRCWNISILCRKRTSS